MDRPSQSWKVSPPGLDNSRAKSRLPHPYRYECPSDAQSTSFRVIGNPEAGHKWASRKLVNWYREVGLGDNPTARIKKALRLPGLENRLLRSVL